MSLVLRIDVDKPYGRTNFTEKVLSKLCEEYWLPAIASFGYLEQLREFLDFLAVKDIKAHIYFRKCTLPSKKWLSESIWEGHKLGLHAENTRSYQTLKTELDEVQKYFHPTKLTSFTKHGSGEWKSGRKHYPVYEPDKYLSWAEKLGIPFLFGNEALDATDNYSETDNYYNKMFWIDVCESNEISRNFQWIIDFAKNRNVIIIIHPSNFIAMKSVRTNMNKLISLAHQANLKWITL